MQVVASNVVERNCNPFKNMNKSKLELSSFNNGGSMADLVQTSIYNAYKCLGLKRLREKRQSNPKKKKKRSKTTPFWTAAGAMAGKPRQMIRIHFESRLSLMVVFLFFVCLVGVSKAIESPQYTAVHKESEFEIRIYRDSAWMSAPANEISFDKATKDGFHRLFQYIQGANLNFSRISMTAPVLTSIVPGAGPLHSSAYFVRLYLPVKFQSTPPLPLPELNLKPDSWSSRCIAVRKFSGFANDGNIVKQAEKLSISLSRSPWADSISSKSEYAYSIAQYNSPFKLIGRVNEVWVELNESALDGCKSSGVATY